MAYNRFNPTNKY